MCLFRQFSMAALLYSSVIGLGQAATWVEQPVMPFTGGRYAANITQSGSIHLAQVGANDVSGFNIDQAILTQKGWEMSTQENPITDFYVGGLLAMEVDKNGAIHLLYNYYDTGSTTYEVRYSTNKSGDWQTETLSDPLFDNNYESCQMAIDAQGKVHFITYLLKGELLSAYKQTPNADTRPTLLQSRLLYTTNSSGNWRTEVFFDKKTEIFFDAQSNHFLKVANSSTLAIDNEGYAHIGYSVASAIMMGSSETMFPLSQKLYYVTNRSGHWESDHIDTRRMSLAIQVGSDPVVGVDDKGDAYMVYLEAKLEAKNSQKISLIHAAKAGSFWKKTVLDSVNGKNNGIDIHGFIVKDNTRHIAYTVHNGDAIAINYASKQLGKEWLKQTLHEDAVPSSVTFSSGSGAVKDSTLMLLGQDNAVHIFSLDDDAAGGMIIKHGTLK